MLIPLVDASASVDSLDAVGIARLGIGSDVFLDFSPSAGASPPSAYRSLLQSARLVVGPFSAVHVDAALAWLDAGASSVLFDCNVTAPEDPLAGAPALAGALGELPASRVLVRLLGVPLSGDEPLSSAASSCARALRGVASGLIFPVAHGAAAPASSSALREIKTIATAVSKTARVCIETRTGMSAADVGRLHASGVDAVAAACVPRDEADAAARAAAPGGALCVGSAIAACVRSDRPDGLFTTVVADAAGKVLGLVYSSKASIVEAVRCGRGVYFSRSR